MNFTLLSLRLDKNYHSVILGTFEWIRSFDGKKDTKLSKTFLRMVSHPYSGDKCVENSLNQFFSQGLGTND